MSHTQSTSRDRAGGVTAEQQRRWSAIVDAGLAFVIQKGHAAPNEEYNVEDVMHYFVWNLDEEPIQATERGGTVCTAHVLGLALAYCIDGPNVSCPAVFTACG